MHNIREENIKRNEEFLSKLGIENIIGDADNSGGPSKKRAAASKRGMSNMAESRKKATPTRRSGRVTTERVKAELADAEREGDSALAEEKRLTLEALRNVKELSETGYVAAAENEYTQDARIRDEEIRLDDDELVSRLRACKVRPPVASTAQSEAYLDRYRSLSLREQDVAKLTPGRTTSTVFLCTDRLVVAAADKTGHVGLWDVDAADGEGVHSFRPHVQGVPKLHSSPSAPHLLYSVRTYSPLLSSPLYVYIYVL